MIYTSTRMTFLDHVKEKYLDYWLILVMGFCFGMLMYRTTYLRQIVRHCDEQNWYEVKSGTVIECSVIEKDGHPWIPEED